MPNKLRVFMSLVPKSFISIDKAKNLLGTHAEELSDLQIIELVKQIDMLTDVVVDLYSGSKYTPGIENNFNKTHTKGVNE